jgi:glucose uptake protein
MILPHTYATTLALTILTMICWGSWANVLKLTKNWRFELLYYDYSFGIFLAAAVAGLTFGTMGGDGLLFADDLAHAGTRNILFGFAGGIVFNLSNILVVGAIAIAGMGVAFPIGVGLALVVGVIWNYFVNPQGHPGLLFTGVALIVAAIVVDAIAYKAHTAGKGDGGTTAGAEPKRSVLKGILLSVIGGILMGMFYPLVEIGKQGEDGLGPYGIGFIFALGILLSTFVFNLYFTRYPIDGPRLTFRNYLQGSWKAHLWGVAGGSMWLTGSLANFVAAISYAIGQGSTMVGATWGVLVWKEFAGGGRKVQLLLVLMFVLFLTGLGIVSVAPLYARR